MPTFLILEEAFAKCSGLNNNTLYVLLKGKRCFVGGNWTEENNETGKPMAQLPHPKRKNAKFPFYSNILNRYISPGRGDTCF